MASEAASLEGPRIRREKETAARMILIYCQGVHPKAEKRHPVMDVGKEQIQGEKRGMRRRSQRSLICDDCYALYKYSHKRLTYCRFGEAKTTCANCPVHCYAPREREEIRRVMRYAGARMLFRHPWLAFRHILDGRDSGARGSG